MWLRSIKHCTMAFAGSCALLKGSAQMSPQPPMAQILRGEYEDKIRRYSPLEKIYLVFASKDSAGEFVMSKDELLQAVCFYNYSENDQEDTKDYSPQHILQFLGSKDKFNVFDYFKLVRFIGCSREDIQAFLKSKDCHRFDEKLFTEFLLDKVYKDFPEQIKSPALFQSRQMATSYSLFQQNVKKSVASIFSAHPTYDIEQVVNLKLNLLRDLYQFEFTAFKQKGPCIDGADFARSIVKYTESSRRRMFLNRINKMRGEFEQIQISEPAYVGFHLYMVENMQELERKLSSKGALSTREIKELINGFVDQKMNVSDQQISIFTKLLDIDNSGFIEKRELMGVLTHLQYFKTVRLGEVGLQDMFWHNVAKMHDKSKRILDILQE